MAKEAQDQYVSIKSKDAVEGGGIFGPGRAVIKKARWATFEYIRKGQTKGKRATVLLVVFNRDGETERVPYGTGSAFKPSADGLHLLTRNAAMSGLPNNCNAYYFLQSFEEVSDHPMPPDWLDTPDQLDGLDVELLAKPIQRTFANDDGKGETTKSKPVLVVSEIYSDDVPWEEGGKGKSTKKTTKAKDADDDDDDDDSDEDKDKEEEEENDDDDDSDEDDDDDDEDEKEKPAAKSKKNGKGKAATAETESDLDEEAIEALIELLGEGPVKYDDLEDDLRASLKGNAQAKVIAARAADEEFLATEKGWSYNAKKKIVTLDD